MAPSNTLSTLLEQSLEPSRGQYDYLIVELTVEPEAILEVFTGQSDDIVTPIVTERCNRIALLFHIISTSNVNLVPPETRSRFADAIVGSLIRVLPVMYEYVEDDPILKTLLPALSIAVEACCTRLRSLAAIVTRRPGFLERLCSHELGGTLVREWVTCAHIFSNEEAVVQEWTNKLSSMIAACIPDRHGARKYIRTWKLLLDTKKQLRSLEQEVEKQEEARANINSNTITTSKQMVPLDPTEKKMGPTDSGRHQHVLDKPRPGLQRSLEAFSLGYPNSTRMLKNHIQHLALEETRNILTALIFTLPCKNCFHPQSGRQNGTEIETEDNRPTDQDILNIRLEAIGSQVGRWKTVLSTKAKKRMDSLQNKAQRKTIITKLQDLSNGTIATSRAGDRYQQSLLKVPLAESHIPGGFIILWQVDIGFNQKSRSYQQQIKIWDIGSEQEVKDTIEQVIPLQANYTALYAERCRERPKGLVPVKFPNSGLANAPDSDLQYKNHTLDEETIQLSSKFYTLTRPVLERIIEGDLSLEYPFDLSEEQVQLIEHSRTSSIILGRSGTGKTTCLIYKLVAKRLAHNAIGSRPYGQILLTTSSFLADKLATYTHELMRTIASKTEDTGADEESQDDAFGPGENAFAQNAVTLDPQAFPLICTFENFLRILENTVSFLDRQNFGNTPRRTGGDSVQEQEDSEGIVDFSTFRLEYWRHFPHALTKGISVNIAFSEIMGVIKGSSIRRHLKQDEYLTKSSRVAPAFTAQDRKRVFRIFEIYEEKKRSRGEVDYVDRVSKLLDLIDSSSDLCKCLSGRFQEVYVDEIQDQRPVDIELFLRIVTDPRGVHFAGDTAQAVAQDTTFRFEDLKSQMFTHFTDVADEFSDPVIARPPIFALRKNYRTHQGILRLATFVMELLYSGFPDTVDKVAPELGDISGPTPTLFVECDPSLIHSSIVDIQNVQQSAIEFGAEQVVLARDAEQKKALRAVIGEAALILTIRQSKGMEFEDVIMVDFFTRCPNERGIRHLADLLKQGEAQTFARDNPDMCSELKNLYVAVTRARIQFIMIESSQLVALAVRKLFSGESMSQVLVDVVHPQDKYFKDKASCLRPGRSMDPVRWAAKGRQFLAQNDNEDALFCFRKAKDAKGEKLAEARLLEDRGRFTADEHEKAIHFDASCRLYMDLGRVSEAVRVLERTQNWLAAGKLWEEAGKFDAAATLYVKAGLLEEAARSFELDGSYPHAVSTLRDGRHYDKLISLLARRRDVLNEALFQRTVRLCKLLMKQGKISEVQRGTMINLLGSQKEQEDFFVQFDMSDELIELLHRQRRATDLCRLHMSNAQLEPAFRVMTTYGWTDTTGVPIPETDLLRLIDFVFVKRWIGSNLTDDPISEIKMGSISSRIPESVHEHVSQWETLRTESKRRSLGKGTVDPEVLSPAFRCLNSLIFVAYRSVHISWQDLSDVPFGILSDVIATIRKLLLDSDIILQDQLMLVTGIWRTPEEKLRLLDWSPLDRNASQAKNKLLEESRNLIMVKFADFMVKLFGRSNVINTLWIAKWPQPCLRFLAGRCFPGLGQTCDRPHLSIDTQTAENQLRGLLPIVNLVCELKQIYYSRLLPQSFQIEYLGMRRYWLRRLIPRLTYVSSLEQSAGLIQKFWHSSLMPKPILASLEDYMFYKINAEWQMMQTYSAIQEMIQLAEALGESVEPRIARALRYQLKFSPNSEQRRFAITIPSLLRGYALRKDADSFRRVLVRLGAVFARLTGFELETWHSVLSLCESITVYLILSLRQTAFLVPSSWIDNNRSWLSRIFTPDYSIAVADGEILTECLFEFAQMYILLLQALDKARDRVNLAAPIPSTRSRGSEILALIVANAVIRYPDAVKKKLWTEFRMALQGFFVSRPSGNAENFEPKDLRRFLEVECFGRYGDKNSLLIITRIPVQKSLTPFKSFESAKIVSLGDIWRDSKENRVGKVYSSLQGEEDTSELAGELTEEDIAVIIKLQRLWRKVLVANRTKKSYIDSVEGKIVARSIKVGAQASITSRLILTTRCSRLWTLLETLQVMNPAETRKTLLDAMEALEAEEGVEDEIDDTLRELGELERQLNSWSLALSDERLSETARTVKTVALSSTLDRLETEMAQGRRKLVNLTERVKNIKDATKDAT